MEYAFIIWVALTPFIMLYQTYEGPKVFWLWIGGFMLAASWIFRIIHGWTPKISQQNIWFAVWIAVLTIASIFGIHPLDSVIGGSYRHQGVLFFITLLLISETIKNLSKKASNILSLLIAVAVCLESIILLIQKINLWQRRPWGTIGEPNAAAGFLAIGLFWIASMNISKWVRLLLSIGVLLAISATGSRTGILASGVVSIGLMHRSVVPIFRKHTKFYFVLLTAVMVIGGLFFYRYTLNVGRLSSPYEDMILFWKLGFDAFLMRPLLGYGAESEEHIYNKMFRSVNVRLIDFMVDRSHNILLDVALWSGIIGLTVFTGWIVSIVILFIRNRDIPILFALADWIGFASIQPVGVVQWVIIMILISNLPHNGHRHRIA